MRCLIFCRICKKFDEISERCQETPEKTADLVALEEYVKNASSVKIIQLQQEVDEAAERLLFLLDYATLPCEYEDSSRRCLKVAFLYSAAHTACLSHTYLFP